MRDLSLAHPHCHPQRPGDLREGYMEGRDYIDCLTGAGALALGHSHPVVDEAAQRALRDP